MHLHKKPYKHYIKNNIVTGIENAPIFIKADNAEKEIEKHLSQTTKKNPKITKE